MTYLRYSPGIETPEADKQATIDGIIESMVQQSKTVEEREHHVVRARLAKSSACVTVEITVTADLPHELAQGLFARPGTYPVAVRLRKDPKKCLAPAFQRFVACRSSGHRGSAPPPQAAGRRAPPRDRCNVLRQDWPRMVN